MGIFTHLPYLLNSIVAPTWPILPLEATYMLDTSLKDKERQVDRSINLYDRLLLPTQMEVTHFGSLDLLGSLEGGT